MFRSLFSPTLRSSTNSHRKPAKKPARRPIGFQCLEERSLLAYGAEFSVGPAGQRQYAVDTASSANGMSVMVWQYQYSPTDSDIMAQLFNANGTKRGGPIVVTNTGKNESSPTVAIDAYGRFAVAWTLQYSASDMDIKARTFSQDGLALTGTIDVATTGKSEYAPSVAMDANGNGIVA